MESPKLKQKLPRKIKKAFKKQNFLGFINLAGVPKDWDVDLWIRYLTKSPLTLIEALPEPKKFKVRLFKLKHKRNK